MGIAENRQYKVSLWHKAKVVPPTRLGFAFGQNLKCSESISTISVDRLGLPLHTMANPEVLL